MSAALALQAPQLLVPEFTPEYRLVIDFETFWDVDFTLRKMTTFDYVTDARFETIGVAVFDGEDTEWLEHEDFIAWARGVPWSKCSVTCHNTLFDGAVMSWRYGIHPGILHCTMSMARAFGVDGGVGLENLAEHFGVGVKGDDVEKVKGMRRRDFSQEQWLRYGQYSKNDTKLCSDIFDAMIDRGFPEPELYVISATLKMFTEPKLIIDEPLLTQYLGDEQRRKQGLLDRIERDKSLVMSNDKFAAELREMGVAPPTKVSVARTKKARSVDPKAKPVIGFAFAKTDPGMQELLEHEEDEVRWLAEARIAVKSTINETRAQRFLRMGKNGFPLPVALKWHGAHTGRWSATDKTNLQNLQRTNKKDPTKGVLRKSLLAPFGWKFVAADSSQIEARIVAWLAGDEELLGLFARNADVYSAFASEIYGRHVDRKKNPDDELPGQVSKVCLVGETPTLTEHRGWVRLDEVRQTDRVWDGVEWANHQGLLDQGVKEVWESRGLAMTPDHEVLTERGWVVWSGVLEDSSRFRSALRSASLPFSAGSGSQTVLEAEGGTLESGVRADACFELNGEISRAVPLLDVTCAQRRSRTELGSANCEAHSRMMHTGIDFLLAAARSLIAATTRRTACFVTTVVAALRFVLGGVNRQSIFFETSSLCLGGTGLSWSSIVETTIEDTSPTTYALSQGERTPRTNDRSETFKTKSLVFVRRTRVYDLLLAGPRKRFTVLSSDGPVVVHNCVLGLGYGQGWFKLAEGFLRGALAPPMQFGFETAQQMGVDLNKWYQQESKVERVRTEMVSRLSIEELQIHCAVSDHLVKTYRKAREPIVKFWHTMEDVLQAMLEDNANYSFGPNECLRVVRHGVELPNGLMLRYPGLEYNAEETKSAPGGFSYLAQYGKKRIHTYGGAMCENVTQALARIVVSEQLLDMMARGYEPQLLTHDDMAFVVPEGAATWLSWRLQETMKTPPSWATGLPLAVEGGIGRSYGEAK